MESITNDEYRKYIKQLLDRIENNGRLRKIYTIVRCLTQKERCES